MEFSPEWFSFGVLTGVFIGFILVSLFVILGDK